MVNGILLVALIRLMFLPFGFSSYLLGVTSVTLLDYMVGSSVYIVKIMLFVFLGCSIYQASEDCQDGQHNNTAMIILITEIVLTVIATIVITIWAKIYFDKKYEEFEKMMQ